MKVIFLHEVKNVAKAGDIKTVNDGYARNYLIPKKIAIISSSSAEQLVQRSQNQVADHLRQERSILKEKVRHIDGKSVKFELKANKSGTTFSGLTKEQISSRLAQEFSIRPEIIEIDIEKPLKHTGEYHVPVKVSSEKILITIFISDKHE